MWLKRLQEAYSIVEAPKPKKLSKLREGKYWYVPSSDGIKKSLSRFEERVGSLGFLNIDMPVDYTNDIYQDHREVATKLVGGEGGAMKRGWLRLSIGGGGERGGISLWSSGYGASDIVSDVVRRVKDISFVMDVREVTLDIYSGYDFKEVAYMVDVNIDVLRAGDVTELSSFNLSPRSTWAK
jgi:hypothetical protein